MSSQKGNVQRKRPQKHQNSVAFKNTLHDTNHRTKAINNTKIEKVCNHCKQVIEWKIKYKKYKPLTQAKTCVRCNQKTVKTAYHVICGECANKLGQCAKCCKSNVEISDLSNDSEEFELTQEMKNIFHILPERRKRTFLRFMERKKKEDNSKEETVTEIMEYLNILNQKTQYNELNNSDEDSLYNDNNANCSDSD